LPGRVLEFRQVDWVPKEEGVNPFFKRIGLKGFKNFYWARVIFPFFIGLLGHYFFLSFHFF